MNIRTRKLAGLLALLVSLIVYPAIATAIYLQLPTALPIAIVLVFFAVAGLGWALPAGAIIKWMSRTKANGSGAVSKGPPPL